MHLYFNGGGLFSYTLLPGLAYMDVAVCSPASLTMDWPRFLASWPRRPVSPRDGFFRIVPLVI
jgi:hypothetical protein